MTRFPSTDARHAIAHLRARIATYIAFVGYLVLFLPLAGCQAFGREETPTATATPAVPPPRAPAAVILPTPPPGATLTAIVKAFRQTRAPAIQPSPTNTPMSARPAPPTTTASPTLAIGPSIYVVPELAEPGTMVEIRGAGWPPGASVTLSFGATVADVSPTDTRGTVRPNGTFAATLAVPADWHGPDAIVIAQSNAGQQRAAARIMVFHPTATATPLPRPTDTALPPPSPTPTLTATPTPGFQGWRGEYYANPTLQGNPLTVRDDETIDFDWGPGSPAKNIPPDNFSVRWTKSLDFPTGGYEFNIQVDDGIRVFLNDELVLNEWKTTSVTSYTFRRFLDGPTDVRIEYFEGGGNATIRFLWRYLGRFPDWRGAYYDNPALAGSPVLVRNDRSIDFRWGEAQPAPDVPADGFSVRWTQTTSLDAGTYRFHAQADDGIRVWVDGHRIINEWHVSTGDESYTATLELAQGSHDLQVEYYDSGGKAEAYLWWENLDRYSRWRGAYFDNPSLAGRPVRIRNDREIDFDWGPNGPEGVGVDDFSVQWIDRRSFQAGVYRFFAEHDDGVRLWVDGRSVIDEWYVTGPITHHGDIQLTDGSHEIQVDYFEKAGDARIHVWWELAPYR